MYSKLMWSGVSLLLSKTTPVGDLDTSIRLDIIKTFAKANTYNYTVAINKLKYKLEYKFTSNVSVVGTLKVTDMTDMSVHNYKVFKKEDGVVLKHPNGNTTEQYSCSNGCYIAVNTEKNVIMSISTLEMTQCNIHQDSYLLRYTSVPTPVVVESNHTLLKTMFAAAGSTDYVKTRCENPIFVGNESVNVIAFSVKGRRIICLTSPSNHSRNISIVRLLNSDFNQIIQYDTPDNDICLIEEYVLDTDKDQSVLKRKYECRCNDDITVITVNDTKDYSITYEEDAITFTKL